MDQKKLKEVANLNDAAVAVFEEYGNRERFRREVNLKRLRRELSHKYGEIDARQLLELFEKLQELGLGAVIYGRGTKGTQFYWNYNLKDVANAAKGKIAVADLVPLKPIPGKKPPVPMPPPPRITPVSRSSSDGHRSAPAPSNGPGELQVFVVNQNNQLRRFKIPPTNNEALMTLLRSLGQAINAQ